MKKINVFFIITILVITVFSTGPVFAENANQPAAAKSAEAVEAPSAADLTKIQNSNFNVLVKFEIFMKPSNNNPRLAEKIIAGDFKLVLNRAMCVEPVTSGIDAADNAKGRYITLLEAEKLILSALGYENEIKNMSNEEIYIFCSELGLNRNLYTQPDKQLTRGETAVLIYNSLTVNYAANPA